MLNLREDRPQGRTFAILIEVPVSLQPLHPSSSETKPLSPSFPERAIAISGVWRMPAERAVSEQSIKVAPPMTDEEAMMRLKLRDRDALALLFERYSRLVFTIAFRILRDYGEAEDLMQSLFIHLYENADSYDPDKGSAKAWITQRVYSRALDRRDFLSHRQIYLGTDPETQPDMLISGFDLERIMELKLLRKQLLEALAELPERQGLTLKMNFFEGLNLHEISERLNESISQVRHHYYRGLNKLRKSPMARNLRGKTL